MGQSKLTLPWGDSTVLEETLARWAQSRVTATVVVLDPSDGALADRCGAKGAEPFVAPRSPADMKASVELALTRIAEQYAPTDDDCWLLAPIDMPWLDPAVADRLIDRHAEARLPIVAPVVNGRRGHPVLFSWSLSREISQLPEGVGVNALLSLHPVDEVDCGQAQIDGDLDSPEDYVRWRNRDKRK